MLRDDVTLQHTDQMVAYCGEEYALTLRKSEITQQTKNYVDDGVSTITARIKGIGAELLDAIANTVPPQIQPERAVMRCQSCYRLVRAGAER